MENLEIKSIRLPGEIWNLLDEDATRCRRSTAKQIEAILAVYFGLDEIELKDVEKVRQIVSPTLEPQSTETTKRKRRA